MAKLRTIDRICAVLLVAICTRDATWLTICYVYLLVQYPLEDVLTGEAFLDDIPLPILWLLYTFGFSLWFIVANVLGYRFYGQRVQCEQLRRHRGEQPCSHPRLEAEFYRGARTGNYLCMQCGEVITPDEKERTAGNEVKKLF